MQEIERSRSNTSAHGDSDTLATQDLVVCRPSPPIRAQTTSSAASRYHCTRPCPHPQYQDNLLGSGEVQLTLIIAASRASDGDGRSYLIRVQARWQPHTMDCISLQPSQDCYQRLVWVGTPQCGLRGTSSTAMKAVSGVAILNVACEDIRLVSTAIDDRLPWNTQLCRSSQSFTRRYEVTPVTGSSSPRQVTMK